MTRMLHTLALMSVLALVVFGAVPKVGEPAPAFSLPNTAGAMVTLKEYAGKSKLVLVFYRGYW